MVFLGFITCTLLFLSVCNAIDDDFGDYWYSNDDGKASGVVEGGDFFDKIHDKSNRQAINKDDDLSEIPDANTESDIFYDSEIKEDSIKEADSNQVLELLKKVFGRRKCDSSNKECARKEFKTGVDFLMNSLPILRIPSNLEVILDGGQLVKEKIINVLKELSDDDQDLMMNAIIH